MVFIFIILKKSRNRVCALWLVTKTRKNWKGMIWKSRLMYLYMFVSVRCWSRNDWQTFALGWRPIGSLFLLWEVHCNYKKKGYFFFKKYIVASKKRLSQLWKMYYCSKRETSQAPRNLASWKLSYQLIWNKTYWLLGLFIIKELIGFKSRLVVISYCNNLMFNCTFCLIWSTFDIYLFLLSRHCL